MYLQLKRLILLLLSYYYGSKLQLLGYEQAQNKNQFIITEYYGYNLLCEDFEGQTLIYTAIRYDKERLDLNDANKIGSLSVFY